MQKQQSSPETFGNTIKEVWPLLAIVLIFATLQVLTAIVILNQPNGLPLASSAIKAASLYDLEGEANRIGNQWGFLARESLDGGKAYGNAKFYATDLEPPEKFQPIYVEGELRFNPVADVELSDDNDDITNRIMHAVPLVEETNEERSN